MQDDDASFATTSPDEGGTLARSAKAEPSPARADERRRLAKRLRRRLKTLSRSGAATAAGAGAVYAALRAVYRTQTRAAGSSDARTILIEQAPSIVGLWHGQHLLAPFMRPKALRFVALLSRNADAEINAKVVARFGIETVRGSGGRAGPSRSDKGGARALISLRQSLREGKSVCMIADIAKGKPREAGLGIVTLARISGRPIIPAAAVTSRRRVVESSWDKTTVPLPFGRLGVVLKEPIFVPGDADDALMEAKRQEVTRAIEAANREAEHLVARRSR